MHQIFSEGAILEEHIFVEPILFFVMLTNIFLWHNLLQEANELDPHVGVVDPAVHNHTNAASELEMHVLISSYINLRMEHLEKLREGV